MSGIEEQKVYEFSGFRIDCGRRVLFGTDGKPIPLKPKVYDTLLFLIEHAGQMLDKASLMRAVWGGVVVEENSLNQHISTLRQSFGEKPGENRFIVTVPGRGYLFVATVHRPSTTAPAPAAHEGNADAPHSDSAPNARRRVAIAATVALAVVTVGAWAVSALRSPSLEPASPAVTRLSLDLGPGQRLSGVLGLEWSRSALQRPSRRSFALSPDGRLLVYAATVDGEARLYKRPLDQTEPVAIPGTDDGSQPFFAPDGKSIGFFVGVDLKTVAVAGGEPLTVASIGSDWDSPALTASWTERDTILVGTVNGIQELPANGGEPRALIAGGGFSTGTALFYPQALPKERGVLFNVADELVPSAWDIVVETREGRRKLLVDGGSDPRYISSGHIVFARGGSLWAVTFDVDRVETTGAAVMVATSVMHAERSTNAELNYGAAQFSVSSSGTLAFVSGGVYPTYTYSLAVLDQNGEIERMHLDEAAYIFPRYSRSGRRLAYSIGVFGDVQIWTYDVDLQVPQQLTNEGHNIAPIWNALDTRIAFARVGKDGGIYTVPTDGSAKPQRVAAGMFPVTSSWSVDDVIAFVDAERETVETIWTVPANGTEAPRRFLPEGEVGAYPDFSPDGKWIAYAALTPETEDLWTVYVRPFPAGGPPQRISSGQGTAPLWSRDGKRLFYVTRDDSTKPYMLMVVDIDSETTLARSRPPRALLEAPWGSYHPTRAFDISADGRSFVFQTRPVPKPPQPVEKIEVVLHWSAELQQRLPLR